MEMHCSLLLVSLTKTTGWFCWDCGEMLGLTASVQLPGGAEAMSPPDGQVLKRMGTDSQPNATNPGCVCNCCQEAGSTSVAGRQACCARSPAGSVVWFQLPGGSSIPIPFLRDKSRPAMALPAAGGLLPTALCRLDPCFVCSGCLMKDVPA